jgi:predicted dinucleotide-binding enzyme
VKTAITGVGNIGPAVAGHLVDGGERVPPTAHYVKAFGTLSAESLANAANRPRTSQR